MACIATAALHDRMRISPRAYVTKLATCSEKKTSILKNIITYKYATLLS